MCGLVGAAGCLNKKEEDAVKALLIVDSIRGEDSTGLAAINIKGELTLAKAVGDPYQLFDTNKCKNIWRQANSVLIGHNRFATVGKVDRANAHPFDVGDIVGVHNGTLTNKHALLNHNMFSTDSEALLNSIQEEGLEKTIKPIMGAYALVWHDSRDGTLNFLRNKERPLFLIYSEDRKTIFWASEAWMLIGVLARYDIKTKGVPFLLEVDKHYSFSIPERNTAFDKPNITEIKQNPTFTHQTSTTGGTDSNLRLVSKTDALTGVSSAFKPLYHSVSAQGMLFVGLGSLEYPLKSFRVYCQSQEEVDKVMKTDKMEGTIGKMVEKQHYYKVPFASLRFTDNVPKHEAWKFKPDHKGYMISADEFVKRKYNTCCFCSSDIMFNETWLALSAEHALCPVCATDKEVLSYIPKVA